MKFTREGKNHMNQIRLNKDQYYINLAADLYLRSTCLRRKFGALIVKNDEIISTGYNGAPRKTKSSLDHEWCWRERHNIPHGKNYELCRSVHAEMNAILHCEVSIAERGQLTLYTSKFPCNRCLAYIYAVGIREIITSDTELAMFGTVHSFSHYPGMTVEIEPLETFK